MGAGDLDRVLAKLPLDYAGPGGAVAVLRDGEVLARHAWGYADLARRIPFTEQTLFRICSITKQFTCALMLDRFPDASALDDDIAARMPLLEVAAPTALNLANNQSGLRDYWAAAMLCGSPVEAPFTEADARRLVGLTRTLHFVPGTRFSYCNQNFRLLGDVVAEREGLPFEDLLRRHVFDRAEMPTALLCADTSAMPDGTVGYEGSLAAGFRPAVNHIHWTGDAGIGASLDDMIAWERFIDATRDRPDSLYQRLAGPATFADGAPARYGLGLGRVKPLGRAGTGHGGGLRGWHSTRFYLPGERISVVVLFNHMADANAAALELLATLVEAPKPPSVVVPDPAWGGAFQEPETGLIVRVEITPEQRVSVRYGQRPDLLDPLSADAAEAGPTRLSRDADGVRLDRGGDNQSSLLMPVTGEATPDVTGTFHSAEYEASFTCISAGGTLYGAFTGFLGDGCMQILLPVGPDLWRLPMPRALDDAPPGDWTLHFHRAAGVVVGVEIGCWLARRVMFTR